MSGFGQSSALDSKTTRNGSTLQNGQVLLVKGGSLVQLGNPPAETGEDWLVVVQKM